MSHHRPQYFYGLLSLGLIVLAIGGLTPLHGALPGSGIRDPNLRLETLVDGLEYPTSMAFLGPDDILVLEKNSGKVRRILNNSLLPEPMLDLDVSNAWERGLLGIAVADAPLRDPLGNGTIKGHKNDSQISQEDDNNHDKPEYIFLYFTKSDKTSKDGGDHCPIASKCIDGVESEGEGLDQVDAGGIANYLYRYELAVDKLVNPKLLLRTPPAHGADHNGGAITIGPDGNVYVIIGDGDSCAAGTCYQNFQSSALNSVRSNFINGSLPDGRGGILRVTQYGTTISLENGSGIDKQEGGMLDNETGLIGDSNPLNKYYAYGIRNSFGIDFDPLTGYLWDTENGAGFGDEINMVQPGFNSGWAKNQGVWTVSNYTATPDLKEIVSKNRGKNLTAVTENDVLVSFGGKGVYSSPEFTWNRAVAPTALVFYDSDKLGKIYENDLFTLSYLTGEIYHFELNENRTALVLEGALKDRIANSTSELESVTFAGALRAGENTEFIGGFTDMEVGPYDGYLYLVSHTEGKLIRIVPTEDIDR